MQGVAYEVRTQVYEGPLDVLLRLVDERRVDLYELRLSEIVDAFLAEIERLQAVDLELATEFLVVAATLLEWKCRRLLPVEDDEDEDGLALSETRDHLLARLVECSTFAAAARRLAELEASARRCVARRAGPDESFAGLLPDLLEGLTPEDLARAARRVLVERAEPRVETEHVLVDELTVAELLGSLLARLEAVGGPITFRRLVGEGASRAEVIVSFLALLELYRHGAVELEQAVHFGELEVRWLGGGERVQAAIGELVGGGALGR